MSSWVAGQNVPAQQLLFRLPSANFNVTTDQIITPYGWSVDKPYAIERVRVINPSLSLTTAAGGIYTAASKAGNALVAAGQAYSGITAVGNGLDLTLTAFGLGQQPAGQTPIFALTTAQGAAATGDLLVYGMILSF